MSEDLIFNFACTECGPAYEEADVRAAIAEFLDTYGGELAEIPTLDDAVATFLRRL
jgi:hypothetical protein